MEKRTRMQRFSAFLSGAAIGLFLLLILTLALGSHFVTAHESQYNYQLNDLIVYWKDRPAVSLMGTVCALAVMLVLRYVVKRGTDSVVRVLFALWASASVIWLVGIRMIPRTDPLMVVNAATAFAQGDFSPLTDSHYFANAQHLLGICLTLEIIQRLLPFADLALTVQLINVAISLSAVHAMVKVIELLTQSSKMDRYSLCAVYLLFLPMPLYCIYAYGTIPMIGLVAWSAFYFIRYLRDTRACDGLYFAILMGFASMLKPNALVALIAFVIIALLDTVYHKRFCVLLYVSLGFILSICLPKAAVWQYEWRSGVRLHDSLSMLAYLTMGLQRCETGPGWFNGYVSQFSAAVMPAEEAKSVILSDLKAQISAFAANPGMLWQFMKEKCVSQWLEPTHSTLYVGSLSEITGRFNGLGYLVYREESSFRLLLERVMDAYQQALYVLAAIGGVCTLKRRTDAAQALLPTIILGGFLYHQLFEAKSQYTYTYAFFLMPLAAQGLTELERAVGRLRGKIRNITL